MATNTREFDLIYIDGDHSPDRVRNDLFEAWRFLSPDGALIIDDVLHRANLDPAAGSEGHLHGVAFAAWQLVFRDKIEELRATDRLLYIPKYPEAVSAITTSRSGKVEARHSLRAGDTGRIPTPIC